MTVAADPDPYFALPSLYGAPAYARPPRGVSDTERPFDPDDLPIVAEQTDDERTLAQVLQGGAGFAQDAPSAGETTGSSGGARRISLRALTGRLGARDR